MPTFHQHARKAVNPGVGISVRHTELIFCLLKLARLARSGDRSKMDFETFCRTQRSHFNRRFGFDDTSPPRPAQIVECVAFASAEYNKLRQVQHVIYRRRVSQKVRGRRSASKKEWAYSTVLWWEAVALFTENLERGPRNLRPRT